MLLANLATSLSIELYVATVKHRGSMKVGVGALLVLGDVVGSYDSDGAWEVEGWMLGSLDGIPLTLGPSDGNDEGVEEGASLRVGVVDGLDVGCTLTEGLKLGMAEPSSSSVEALDFWSSLCELATSPISRPSARAKVRRAMSPSIASAETPWTRPDPSIGRGVSLLPLVSLQSCPFGRCSISPS